MCRTGRGALRSTCCRPEGHAHSPLTHYLVSFIMELCALALCSRYMAYFAVHTHTHADRALLFTTLGQLTKILPNNTPSDDKHWAYHINSRPVFYRLGLPPTHQAYLI